MAWINDIANGENAGSVRNKINSFNEEVAANGVTQGDIVDDLVTEDATKVLSANQGKILNAEIGMKPSASDIMSSCIAFCSNANEDSINAALGSMQPNVIIGLGPQLAKICSF